MIGFVITFLAGSLVGTEGFLWKTQENNRAKMQLELAKYETAKGLRIEIDNVYQNIFTLNNDFINRSRKEKIKSLDTLQYRRRLIYFLENYQSFEEKLSKIEEREKRSVFIPAPITDIIERPSKPEFVMIRKVENTSFWDLEIYTSLWLFILIFVAYSMSIILIVVYFYRRIISRKIQ
jgi:hypothetical protein